MGTPTEADSQGGKDQRGPRGYINNLGLTKKRRGCQGRKKVSPGWLKGCCPERQKTTTDVVKEQGGGKGGALQKCAIEEGGGQQK